MGFDLYELFGARAGLRLDAFAAELPRFDQLRASSTSAVEEGAVFHVDRMAVHFDADSAVYHENGFVDVWGVATRTDVFMYAGPDGRPFPELRPAEEVLAEESLATILGIPFTVDHPRGMVDSSNFRDLVHGYVIGHRVEQGAGPRGEDLVWTHVRIASDDAKAVLDTGVVELSMGYTAVVVDQEGTSPAGIPYKAIQTKIRYNHLALVSRARAGAVARLHLDQNPRITVGPYEMLKQLQTHHLRSQARHCHRCRDPRRVYPLAVRVQARKRRARGGSQSRQARRPGRG